MKGISELAMWKRDAKPADCNGFTEENEYPPLSELQDGAYRAIIYDWVFELADGRKFSLPYGIRQSRRMSSFRNYEVRNGDATEVTEFGNGLERHISELPDGTYEGRWYAYCLELSDGRKYKTDTGVLRSRELTPVGTYSVKNGIVREVQ